MGSDICVADCTKRHREANIIILDDVQTLVGQNNNSLALLGIISL